MTDLEPIDDTHRQALEARNDIRIVVAWLRAQVAVWEPRPMPAAFYRNQERNP